MSSSRITELATLVQINTAKVDGYLREHNLPFPSFDEDGPVDFKLQSEEIQDARTAAMEASLELHDLLLGPSMCLRPVVCDLGDYSFFGALLICSSLAERDELADNLQIRYPFQGPAKWRNIVP